MTYDEILASIVRKEKHTQKPSQYERIYTVTTIARDARHGGQRTPGIFTTFQAAQDVVEKNSNDLWENSYMLAVIEAVVPNWLYSSGLLMEQYWYFWDNKLEKYVPIEIPEDYQNLFGFGIG